MSSAVMIIIIVAIVFISLIKITEIIFGTNSKYKQKSNEKKDNQENYNRKKYNQENDNEELIDSLQKIISKLENRVEVLETIITEKK